MILIGGLSHITTRFILFSRFLLQWGYLHLGVSSPTFLNFMNKINIISAIFFFSFVGTVFFLSDYLISPNSFVGPRIYKNEKIGITFSYPSNLVEYYSGNEEYILFETKDHSGGGLSLSRMYGFGGQDWSDDVFTKPIYASTTTQTITFAVNGKKATAEFWPDSPEDKTLYIPVDDALFVISLRGVDFRDILKNLKFTKPQVMPDYHIINEVDHKTFVNPIQGYQVDIPNGWGFTVSGAPLHSSQESRSVSLGEPYEGMFFGIYITVAPSSQKTLSVANTLYYQEKFEKNITVGGTDAIVAHEASAFEEFPSDKKIFILKNGFLYTIHTRNDDYEKILKGFKFLSQ